MQSEARGSAGPAGSPISSGSAGCIALIDGTSEPEPVLAEARRLATLLQTGWTAVYVETPNEPGSSAAAEALSLAAELGSEVVSIPAASRADGLLAYGRSASHFVVASSALRRTIWRRSIVECLASGNPAASVVVVPCRQAGGQTVAGATRSQAEKSLAPYLIAAAAVLATLPAVLLLRELIGGQGLALLYLLPVLGVASNLGIRPALLASLLSAVSYNYLVLKPAYSFHLGAPQDLLVLGTFVLLSAYLSLITGRLRRRALLSDRSAQENASLAALGLTLTRASNWEDTAEALCRETAALLGVEAIVLREMEGELVIAGAFPAAPQLSPIDRAALDWSWANGREAGSGTDTLPAANWQFRPLTTSLARLAVLALARPDGRNPVDATKQVLLSTIVAQAALAHERLLLEDQIRGESCSGHD